MRGYSKRGLVRGVGSTLECRVAQVWHQKAGDFNFSVQDSELLWCFGFAVAMFGTLGDGVQKLQSEPCRRQDGRLQRLA